MTNLSFDKQPTADVALDKTILPMPSSIGNESLPKTDEPYIKIMANQTIEDGSLESVGDIEVTGVKDANILPMDEENAPVIPTKTDNRNALIILILSILFVGGIIWFVVANKKSK